MFRIRFYLLTLFLIIFSIDHLESTPFVFAQIEISDTIPNNFHPLEEAVSSPDKVWKLVEEMPLFEGCDFSNMTLMEKKNCSDIKLINYIVSHMKYPRKARKKGTEGKVFVRFIVDRDGSVVDPEIVQDIGHGCGEAALKVVKGFPKWIPGKMEGKTVRVLYTLPFTFKLTN